MGAARKFGKRINLSLLKPNFLTKFTIARRFKGLAVEQIFRNFKRQCKTRQIFQPLSLHNFLALKFRIRKPFFNCLKIHTVPLPGF